MPTTTWSIVSKAGKQHAIRLEHGHFSGKREITVDQNVVAKGKQLIDGGSRHLFPVDDSQVEVVIFTNGMTFQYYLLFEGSPVPSDEQKKKGISTADLLKNKFFHDLPIWQELSRYLGLSYKSRAGTIWDYRHYIIGLRSGYMVQIQKGMHSRTQRQVWVVLVRHAPYESPEQVDRIRSNQGIKAAQQGLKKFKDDLGFADTYTYIYLAIKPEETAFEISNRIQAFFQAVSMHTRPIPDGVCENDQCKRTSGELPEWFLLNGVPYYWCQDCISQLPDRLQASEQAYQQAPQNLLPGLLAGFGVALLGAVLWAALGILMGAGLISTFVVLFLIVGVFQKVGTKTSLSSVVATMFFAFFSTTLGQCLFVLLLFLRQGFPISALTIAEAFATAISDRSTMSTSYLFAFFGLIYILWLWISGHRSALKHNFHPSIEKL